MLFIICSPTSSKNICINLLAIQGLFFAGDKMSRSASLSVRAWDGVSVKNSTPSSTGAHNSFLFVGSGGGGGGGANNKYLHSFNPALF